MAENARYRNFHNRVRVSKDSAIQKLNELDGALPRTQCSLALFVGVGVVFGGVLKRH